jgi:hypothetical protein
MNSFINLMGFLLLTGLVASWLVGGNDELVFCHAQDEAHGHGVNYARIDCGWQAIQAQFGLQ